MHRSVYTALLSGLACCLLPAADNAASASGKTGWLKEDSALRRQQWIHGATDCQADPGPEHDVYAHDLTTLIIRQNKCTTFEAPFIYVLAGKNTVLVYDTGDIEEPAGDSLYETIRSHLGPDAMTGKSILVIHSHSHGDHSRGDSHFTGKPAVTLVQPNRDAVQDYFGFKNWPHDLATIELGDRNLVVLPTPGHQEEAITIYDRQTRWLLTGDTLYPGYIYVKDWQAYRDSIKRLSQFAADNAVSAVLGSHIEMTRDPGKYYPIGTTFQPREAQLDLALEDLTRLDRILQQKPEEGELVFDNFIVKPMNAFQKAISDVARWLTQ